MPTRVDHTAMAAVGFVTPWSVRAGSEVSLHLSCVDPRPRVRVIRLDEDVPSICWQARALTDAVGIESFERGSWLELPWNGVADAPGVWSFAMEFCLTHFEGSRTLIAGPGFRLDIDSQLRPVLSGDAPATCRGARLETLAWYHVSLAREAIGLLEAKIRRVGEASSHAHLSIAASADVLAGSWALGTPLDQGTPTLNVKMARVAVAAGSETHRWSFGSGCYATALAPDGGDRSLGAAPRLVVHNGPTFAMRSTHGVDAVHLHDDDAGHCDWPVTHLCCVPETAAAGIYAFEVITAMGTEQMPFFVRSARPSAAIVFLVPTATYLAYSNEYLPADRYPWRCEDRGHRFAQDNQLRSVYDVHTDGSGVTVSTSRQPHALLRADYRYPLSDSPHLLPVDLQLLNHLHRRGIAVDLLTDHDLHAEGQAALEPYAAVFTGSHPEYWSSAMMTALDGHLDRGGHLAYLGGNGFYLSVAFGDERMELRRDPRDVIWSGEPTEMAMAFSAEQGGYWESRGRAAQSLAGSTFLMMGFGPSRSYRRLPASHSPEWAWVFDGVGERPIGDTGTVSGGAAGYEVDGVIEGRSTPPSLARLATADDFDISFQVRAEVAEAKLENDAHLRRADMTIYRHRGGGLVFSVGSVAWCGSLPVGPEDNPVGRITTNIARRFAAPAPWSTHA